MRDITGQLRDAVLSRLRALPNGSAEQRLQAIVGGNFDETQVSGAAMKAWLAFWASSMHQPMLYRLQQVSSRRLLSNWCTSSAASCRVNRLKRRATGWRR